MPWVERDSHAGDLIWLMLEQLLEVVCNRTERHSLMSSYPAFGTDSSQPIMVK